MSCKMSLYQHLNELAIKGSTNFINFVNLSKKFEGQKIDQSEKKSYSIKTAKLEKKQAQNEKN